MKNTNTGTITETKIGQERSSIKETSDKNKNMMHSVVENDGGKMHK